MDGSGHYRKVCRCGDVVAQCRCPSLNKTIITVTCDRCKQMAEERRKKAEEEKNDLFNRESAESGSSQNS